MAELARGNRKDYFFQLGWAHQFESRNKYIVKDEISELKLPKDKEGKYQLMQRLHQSFPLMPLSQPKPLPLHWGYDQEKVSTRTKYQHTFGQLRCNDQNFKQKSSVKVPDSSSNSSRFDQLMMISQYMIAHCTAVSQEAPHCERCQSSTG